jgi:hypothetical protein
MEEVVPDRISLTILGPDLEIDEFPDDKYRVGLCSVESLIKHLCRTRDPVQIQEFVLTFAWYSKIEQCAEIMAKVFFE